VYNAQLDRSIARQVGEMEKLTNSTKEVTNTKRQIVPLLVKMTDALEVFISNDIPFKIEERLAGIARIKDLIDDPDVEASEKFRSIFEAYQIESDYGRSIQSYKQKVNVDGQERDVDMLMVGRVALLYQTSDGSVSAAYNKVTKSFEEVDEGTYKNSIAEAMRVANKTIAADRLIALPISAPESAQ